ncbi:MAG: signal peptidase I [Lachnospiraceae bacterium]|nr:signal peptidase I [Lachnospiraceae bacterium]
MKREWIRLGIKLGLTATALVFVLNLCFGLRINYGNFAWPSVRDGDLVIYRIWGRRSPEPGQLAVYRDGEEIRVARVIAAQAGQSVDITAQGVLVDGSILAEEAVFPTDPDSVSTDLPLTLQEGEVFLLHDYRSDDRDSRTLGPVPAEDLLGTVVLVIRWRGF